MVARARRTGVSLVFDGEADLERHLPEVNLAFVDAPASFDDLEPAQVLDRFLGAFERTLDSILNGGGGGACQFDEFVNGIFHGKRLGMSSKHGGSAMEVPWGETLPRRRSCVYGGKAGRGAGGPRGLRGLEARIDGLWGAVGGSWRRR